MRIINSRKGVRAEVPDDFGERLISEGDWSLDEPKPAKSSARTSKRPAAAKTADA